MKILITNDDGIFAPGINELAKALVKKGHELLIAAPGRTALRLCEACAG